MFSPSNDSFVIDCLVLVPYFMLLCIIQAINPRLRFHEMVAVPESSSHLSFRTVEIAKPRIKAGMPLKNDTLPGKLPVSSAQQFPVTSHKSEVCLIDISTPHRGW